MSSTLLFQVPPPGADPGIAMASVLRVFASQALDATWGSRPGTIRLEPQTNDRDEYMGIETWSEPPWSYLTASLVSSSPLGQAKAPGPAVPVTA